MRDPGYDSQGRYSGDCFHDYREWKKEMINYKPHATHWWNGEPDFQLAVESWNNEKNT